MKFLLRTFILGAFVILGVCLFFAATAAIMGDWGNFIEVLASAGQLTIALVFLHLVMSR
jgi:hypothetical protein